MTSRRFRPHRYAPYVLAAIGLLAAWRLVTPTPPVNRPPPDVLEEGEYALDHVVDGDTLLLSNGARIRLIGVDTPETVRPEHPVEPWGPEATEFVKAHTAAGAVRLQFDKERKDRYGRFLAHVFAPQENGSEIFLSEELLRAGLGRALLRYPYSVAMKRRFREAEDEARRAKRGIWSGQRAKAA